MQVSSGRAEFGDVLRAYLAIMLAAMGLAQAHMDFPHVANAKSAIKRIFPLLRRVPVIDASNPDGLTPIEVRNKYVYLLRLHGQGL